VTDKRPPSLPRKSERKTTKNETNLQPFPTEKQAQSFNPNKKKKQSFQKKKKKQAQTKQASTRACSTEPRTRLGSRPILSRLASLVASLALVAQAQTVPGCFAEASTAPALPDT